MLFHAEKLLHCFGLALPCTEMIITGYFTREEAVMTKHFLVTVSRDTQNLFGVQFLCSFFNELSDHKVTLLHICRLDHSDMNKSLMEMWSAPRHQEKVANHLSPEAERCLEKAKELLSKSQMGVDQLLEKTVLERYGKVKDILNEGERGLYDAIILGRRAAYALQWVFERPADAIAQALIRDTRFTSPVWICPEPEQDRKNVLLCVDGSDNSMRTVDHVGYVLNDQPQHQVTLFYVENGGDMRPQEVFTRATTILHEHKIGTERIKRKATWGFGAVNPILRECARGGFAAVAVGLHGQESTRMKTLNLAGGTTAKLISKIECTALWCCP